VRFLVDAQLPPALARYLSSIGHHAEHVADIGLAGAEDPTIWDYALHTSAAIITKDEDFAIRGMLKPSGPPVIWLRIGNSSKRALLNWFGVLLPIIERDLAAGEKLIEVV
jgi:predicted nuclease of predicted toxin-antitoxin system